jgi:UDPglucose 6-dehydrogenase
LVFIWDDILLSEECGKTKDLFIQRIGNFKMGVNISVVGLGKLGLCVAACFASKGYNVVGVDIDSRKIEEINKGESPINETGLNNLLAQSKNNLRATSNYEDAVQNSDVTFIVVATPSLTEGSFSNEYLKKAVTNIAEVIKKKDEYHLIVISSTVMPQTTEGIVKPLLEEISGKKCGPDFGLAYNPEFIALGSVIRDFLNPDLILIGEVNKKEGDILQGIFEDICENNPHFARMRPINAEITKIALNCYITTKITFANSLASLCEEVSGADAHVVTQALGLDSRIGSKYIKPGLGFGGPCFPRDNIAFSAFARGIEVGAKLAETVDEVNREQALRVEKKIKKILERLGKDKENINIAVLGLSYKANTPVIDESQAITIAGLLVKAGYHVSVYDPQAKDNAVVILNDTVRYAEDKYDCLKGVDLAVIAVPWPEFKEIDFDRIDKRMIFLDCWRILEYKEGVDIRYLGKS